MFEDHEEPIDDDALQLLVSEHLAAQADPEMRMMSRLMNPGMASAQNLTNSVKKEEPLEEYDIGSVPYSIFSRMCALMPLDDLSNLAKTSKANYKKVCSSRGIHLKLLLSECFVSFESGQEAYSGARCSNFSVQIYQCPKCQVAPLGWYRGRKMWDYLLFDENSYFFGHNLTSMDRELINLLPRNMNYCFLVERPETSIPNKDMDAIHLYMREMPIASILSCVRSLEKVSKVRIWCSGLINDAVLKSEMAELTKTSNKFVDITFYRSRLQFTRGRCEIAEYEAFQVWAKHAGVYLDNLL